MKTEGNRVRVVRDEMEKEGFDHIGSKRFLNEVSYLEFWNEKTDQYATVPYDPMSMICGEIIFETSRPKAVKFAGDGFYERSGQLRPVTYDELTEDEKKALKEAFDARSPGSSIEGFWIRC